MMKTIKPPKLNLGDSVGVVSPSSSLHDRADRFNKAVETFENTFDLKIEIAPHALGRHWYSSGTVEERLADFHQMISDPTIKAVFFSVGGHTAIELVDKLDYQLISDNPKIISGISDSATLLNPITAKTGIITFSGLEFCSFGYNDVRSYEIEYFKKTWFDGEIGEVKSNPSWRDWKDVYTTYDGWKTIRQGKTSGRVYGSNFEAIFQSINTEYFPDLENNILTIETYKHDKKRLHQSLYNLRMHGIFDQISGLIIGYCVGSDDPNYFGDERNLKDLVLEVTSGYDFPIMQVGEIGHYVENIALPIGAKVTMDATNLKFSIDESVAI